LHPARAFIETDAKVLIARASERGFAVIVAVDGGRPVIGHAPVLVDERLARFHLSRANPLTAALISSGAGLAVITGEDAYISPDWYGVDDQVPTWNYVSVEIEGPIRRLAAAETVRLLDELSARYESALTPKPAWTRAKMSSGQFEAMTEAIVGFALSITRLEGVTKLSQNKPRDAIQAAAAALAALDDAGARAVSTRMLSQSRSGAGK
jgi:transcriptional regulator